MNYDVFAQGPSVDYTWHHKKIFDGAKLGDTFQTRLAVSTGISCCTLITRGTASTSSALGSRGTLQTKTNETRGQTQNSGNIHRRNRKKM